MTRRRRWRLWALAALVLGSSAVLGALPAAAAEAPAPVSGSPEIPVTVAIPGTGTFEVEDAQLLWGLNLEAGGGAYFGGCNFLSAGAAGNAGSSRLWSEADGLYRTAEGDVTIEKPDASGAYAPPTWATRCQNPAGVTVTSATTRADNFTRNRVRVDGGTGEVDAAHGTATIRWTGSFTVVFYGGLTYWTASDPVLTVTDGSGTLQATLSGYGADMNDTTRWVPLPERTVTLATLRDVGFGSEGFTVTPVYCHQPVDVGSGTPQLSSDPSGDTCWGSFPQDFVDFQVETGQSSYWYTSGGARDAAKPATPLTVSYDASNPVPGGDDTGASSGSAVSPVNRAVFRPTPTSGGSLAGTGVATTQPVAVPAVGPAATVLASRSLIPTTAGPAGSPTAGQVAALVGLAGLVLASGAALGLVKGWLAIPWRP